LNQLELPFLKLTLLADTLKIHVTDELAVLKTVDTDINHHHIGGDYRGHQGIKSLRQQKKNCSLACKMRKGTLASPFLL
jgi:hypothetical protein